MNVSVVAKSEVSRTLKIEVPAETVAAEYERVYARAAQGATLPGFRKGKVPRQILEPRISGSINQELLESLLPQATFDAVQKESLKAVGRPKIEDLKFTGKGPLSFQAIIEVKPEIKLGKVEGVAIDGPDDKVSDKDVDEQVEALRQRGAKEGAVKETAAALGDWVRVDFQGFIDGQPFPGGQATDFQMVLGRKQLIPGFEEQLVGAKTGETRQVKVQFPADYPAQELAGKDAEFTTAVKEVKLMELPAVDEAWAKTFGEEVTGVDFLRERLKEALQTQKADLRKRVLMDKAAEALIADHKFTVPESLIDAEAHALEQVEMRRLQQQGMEFSGPDGHAQLHKALAEPAEKRARLALVLEAIAEAQKIEVQAADFDAEMVRFARQLGTSPAEATRWAKQQGREEGIKAQLRERKALEWVVEKAKITTTA
jgi:trigger factor